MKTEKLVKVANDVKILMHQNDIVWLTYMQHNDVSRSEQSILKAEILTTLKIE